MHCSSVCVSFRHTFYNSFACFWIGFLKFDLDETITEASKRWSIFPDTISRLIRNLHVLQDSRKRLRQSWWKFHCSFLRMHPPTWHHLQVHQEPPCPPRLQEESKRTCGVLTGFLKSNLDENFTEASKGCSFLSNTISRFIRNLYVL